MAVIGIQMMLSMRITVSVAYMYLYYLKKPTLDSKMPKISIWIIGFPLVKTLYLLQNINQEIGLENDTTA